MVCLAQRRGLQWLCLAVSCMHRSPPSILPVSPFLLLHAPARPKKLASERPRVVKLGIGSASCRLHDLPRPSIKTTFSTTTITIALGMHAKVRVIIALFLPSCRAFAVKGSAAAKVRHRRHQPLRHLHCLTDAVLWTLEQDEWRDAQFAMSHRGCSFVQLLSAPSQRSRVPNRCASRYCDVGRSAAVKQRKRRFSSSLRCGPAQLLARGRIGLDLPKICFHRRAVPVQYTTWSSPV